MKPGGFMPCGGSGASNGSGIDASIAAKADYEHLYDRSFEDKKRVRVAGHRGEPVSPPRHGRADGPPNADGVAEPRAVYQVTGGEKRDFAAIVLDNPRTAGVQQAHKEDKIAFIALTPWPGDAVCAVGLYPEGDEETGLERRAGIFVARNSVLSPARTWWTPPGKPPKPALTCSSPAPSTTTPAPQGSPSWARCPR